MLGGDDNEKGQKKSVCLISKKTTLNVQQTFFFCIFLSRCFTRLECETSRNLIVTRFIEEMLYAFSAHFFSMLLICTLVAVSISHFLTADVKFSFFYSNKIGLLCSFFLSLALPLSLLSTSI